MKRIGIEIKVTDRCNLNCFHCMNNDGDKGGLDLDCVHLTNELRRWADAQTESGYGIKEVRMTGGEPLLNLDAVTEIALTCRSLGIVTGINTNATLLTRSVAERLKESGLEIIKASFDTTDEKTFGRMRGMRFSLERTLEGIRTAIHGGFRVILRLTLCSYNCRQLLDCYYMARDMGAEKLQIKPLVRSGRAFGSEAFLTRAQVRQAFGDLANVVSGTGAVPEILCWPSEDSAGLSCKACGSLNKIYVYPNYHVTTCNYLLKTNLLGILGTESLERIFSRWESETPQNVGGHYILRGCPQADFFNS